MRSRRSSPVMRPARLLALGVAWAALVLSPMRLLSDCPTLSGAGPVAAADAGERDGVSHASSRTHGAHGEHGEHHTHAAPVADDAAVDERGSGNSAPHTTCPDVGHCAVTALLAPVAALPAAVLQPGDLVPSSVASRPAPARIIDTPPPRA